MMSSIRLFASIAATALFLVGCGAGSNSSQQAAEKPQVSPRERLQELAQKYRNASSYQDAGELRFLVDGAPESEFRSLPFSVAFERPNRLRIHVLDTMSVADGKLLRSIVQSLPDQVLVQKCPSEVTVASLTSDEMLAKAMHGQLKVDMPQLLLLAGDRPLDTLTRDCTPEQLSDSEFQGKKCWRISLTGPAGKSIVWIEQQSGLLLKYEFPLEEIRREFPLARLWAEFRGATIGEPVNPVAFQMELPTDSKLVKHFVMPPPPAPPALLGKPLDNFTFIALDGTALGNESLANKVVVFDLWATWCGWCFEGLPLLEKVYQQYQDNDQVVFLAVNKDQLSISNAKVEDSFKQNGLTLPIVRDQEQITDQLFQLQGLPTTIIVGRDGTVQDYHIGYDPKLPETLPAKLEKLIAGENIAQAELDAYAAQKQEFEQRLAEATLKTGDAPKEPEVARRPGSPQ